MVERWIRQCRSRRPASKVFEDAGSRVKDQRGGRYQCSTALTTFRGLD